MASRNYRLFVCSYLISGKLLNLELNFIERPLLSELRARVVNAFRAEEQALIDRSQSIGYDVAAMFIFSTARAVTGSGILSVRSPAAAAAASVAAAAMPIVSPPARHFYAGGGGGRVVGGDGAWRILVSEDIVEGLQIYAQPRLSTSIMRTLCDSTSEALEYQRIPPPRRPLHEDGATSKHPFHDGSAATVNSAPDMVFLPSASSVVSQRPVVMRRALPIGVDTATTLSPRGTKTTTMLMSSDDDDDNDEHGDDDFAGDEYASGATPTTDLALAECWDEAVRRLFRELDDDFDGLLDLAALPATLERMAAGLQDPFRPELFPSVARNNHRRSAGAGGGVSPIPATLVDEQSFIAFCNRAENTGIVAGLLAFISNASRAKAAMEFERSMMRRRPLSRTGGAASQQEAFDEVVARQWNSPLNSNRFPHYLHQ